VANARQPIALGFAVTLAAPADRRRQLSAPTSELGLRQAGGVTVTDLDRSIDEAERLFVAAGQAKVKAEAMDLRRKRVRATLFVKYKADGNPAGASEQMAEADPVYELACNDWESTAMDAETLRAQAESKRMRFESWRTQNATKRAQMNLR
jgi:hypothetical protein